MARKRFHTRRKAKSNPRGRIDVKRGGYGFVQTPEGEYFVPRKSMRGAFPGDLVEIAPVKASSKSTQMASGQSQHKRMARVVAVVERAYEEIVGYYHRAEPFGIVEPADPLIQHSIFTQLSAYPDIPDGAVVRVAISTYPDKHAAATGSIVEVLGDEDDERVAIDLIVARHKLETTFSDAVIAQAEAAAVGEGEALGAGYRDLRDRVIFTIDPADARDFDDAVSLDRVEYTRKGLEPAPALAWRLGVHIADVSHYVPWGSPVDLEARKRATSAYLVDRVIPMLPEKLSNEICSLKPDEVRRTMTVDVYVTDDGDVLGVEPYPALIRSCSRLTYDQAQEMLDASRYRCAEEFSQAFEAGAPESQPVELRVAGLSWLAKLRAANREKAGGLDFDTVEAKVRLGDDGYPLGIDLREKTEATQLIEEAMILANEAVARYLRDAGFPCVFRVHEQPGRDALEGLVPVLSEFSWFRRVNEASFIAGDPRAIQSVLGAARGRPEEVLVSTLVLRAMKRAVYSPRLDAHFGLASNAYCHFTSPIRRYPDLIVHRMLKASLFGRPEKFDQEVSSLDWLAEHSSEIERVAERASRESQEVKIIELMESHVGETFTAVISGVTTFGLFVRLENTAEGVVEMADLGREYFILDPARHSLTGSDTGKQFRLGGCLTVRLVEADYRTRQLRFRLAEANA